MSVDHDHAEEYAEWDHEHEEYADVEHDHDEDYAYDDHDHEELADREHEHQLDDVPDAASADDLEALEERVKELEAKLEELVG